MTAGNWLHFYSIITLFLHIFSSPITLPCKRPLRNHLTTSSLSRRTSLGIWPTPLQMAASTWQVRWLKRVMIICWFVFPLAHSLATVTVFMGPTKHNVWGIDPSPLSAADWLWVWLCATDLPSDCCELFTRGERASGMYTIKPNQSEPFMAYCDMDQGKTDNE